MTIMDRRADIAILKAMGCPEEGILRIFALQGLLIGLSGVALGLGAGILIAVHVDGIQRAVEGVLGFDVLPENVYQLPGLVYAVEPLQLAGIALISLILSIGSTLTPSLQAARLDPAEALRGD
jgi:lipoprotein-releasing system permease protein